MCLCVDLIMTMFSPFKPASTRVKWYMLFSFSDPVIIVLSLVAANQEHYAANSDNNDCINTYYNPGYDSITSGTQSQLTGISNIQT